MRVVISALTAPAELNGVSRHALNLARGLLSLADGPEVHFIAGAWQAGMFAELGVKFRGRCHVHFIAMANNNFNRLAWHWWELPHIAAQLEADVLHLACPALIRAGVFHRPVLVSLHDLYPFDIPENFGRIKGMINRQIMRKCLTIADAIACVSESTRASLDDRLGGSFSSKAATIYNAVESPPSTTLRPPRALERNRPFLLCVAQHRRNKNIPLSLEVFVRALRRNYIPSDSHFAIVGIEGPETRDIYRKISALGLEGRVALLTGISDAELQWCYRNCKLLLAPSSIEGFGLPVAEALLAGCPVVCSDIPAFREIGGMHCRYVDLQRDPVSGFVEGIRATLGQARIAPVCLPELSVPFVGAQSMKMYRRVLGLSVPESSGVENRGAGEIGPLSAPSV
jgi:glycosyltransferase involved in cell wall biosynthesis